MTDDRRPAPSRRSPAPPRRPPRLPALGGGADALGTGGDSNGIKGGDYTFVVSVSDSAFAPAILKSENDANITLTVQNTGTKPHDLVVDGMPGAVVPALAPGSSATVMFTTPDMEGTYSYRSTQAGDAMTGQFILQ
jgi:FtsP/CotA-like multicopper oxidase with cupredoxin domain